MKSIALVYKFSSDTPKTLTQAYQSNVFLRSPDQVEFVESVCHVKLEPNLGVLFKGKWYVAETKTKWSQG